VSGCLGRGAALSCRVLVLARKKGGMVGRGMVGREIGEGGWGSRCGGLVRHGY
jgi:hypothetical protein